jgi:hypothetical protein
MVIRKISNCSPDWIASKNYECICETCSRVFRDRIPKKFCSRSCSISHRNTLVILSGSDNPNWKGGSKSRYKTEHIDRVKANNVVSELLRRRKITPLPCEICGEQRYTQAHHQDYSKPLNINWLCSSCHMRIHFAVRELRSVAR